MFHFSLRSLGTLRKNSRPHLVTRTSWEGHTSPNHGPHVPHPCFSPFRYAQALYHLHYPPPPHTYTHTHMHTCTHPCKHMLACTCGSTMCPKEMTGVEGEGGMIPLESLVWRAFWHETKPIYWSDTLILGNSNCLHKQESLFI